MYMDGVGGGDPCPERWQDGDGRDRDRRDREVGLGYADDSNPGVCGLPFRYA